MAIGLEKQELKPYEAGIGLGGQDKTGKYFVTIAGAPAPVSHLLKEYYKAEEALASLKVLQDLGPKAEDLEKQAIELARTTSLTTLEAIDRLKLQALTERNQEYVEVRQQQGNTASRTIVRVDQPRKPARRKGRRK